MADLMSDRWNKGATDAPAKRQRKTKPAADAPAASEKKERKTKKTPTEKKAVAKVDPEIAKKAVAKVDPEIAKKAKEAEIAKAEKSLVPVAKEVNVRLEKATHAQDKADDHRLAAALQLAKARATAEKSGLNFKKWAADNIKQSYETVRKLVAVGDSDDPKAALEAMRSKNAEQMRKAREAQKRIAPAKEMKNRPAQEQDVDVALRALDRMSDSQRRKLIEGVAQNEGLAVVPVAEKRPDPKPVDLTDAAKLAFLALGKLQRKTFLDWANSQIENEAKMDKAVEAGEMPEMPAALRRERKTKRAAE